MALYAPWLADLVFVSVSIHINTVTFIPISKEIGLFVGEISQKFRLRRATNKYKVTIIRLWLEPTPQTPILQVECLSVPFTV